MKTRQDVIREARAWLGTPWLHQARLRGIGADCIGFIGGVALALGLPEAAEWAAAPEYHNYGRQPDPKVMLRGCRRFLDPIEAVRLADVLLIRFEVEPMHFAIVSRESPRAIIHALSSAGKVCEHHVDAVWSRRTVRAYRFRGIA